MNAQNEQDMATIYDFKTLNNKGKEVDFKDCTSSTKTKAWW